MATPVSTGCAAMKRSNATPFAASTAGWFSVIASAQPASRSPSAGGFQSSATQLPPAATTLSAKPRTPAFSTLSVCLKRGLAGKADPGVGIKGSSSHSTRHLACDEPASGAARRAR